MSKIKIKVQNLKSIIYYKSITFINNRLLKSYKVIVITKQEFNTLYYLRENYSYNEINKDEVIDIYNNIVFKDLL